MPHPLVARDKRITALKKAEGKVPKQRLLWEKQLRKNVRHNPYLQMVLDDHEAKQEQHKNALNHILNHLLTLQQAISPSPSISPSISASISASISPSISALPSISASPSPMHLAHDIARIKAALAVV